MGVRSMLGHGTLWKGAGSLSLRFVCELPRMSLVARGVPRGVEVICAQAERLIAGIRVVALKARQGKTRQGKTRQGKTGQRNDSRSKTCGSDAGEGGLLGEMEQSVSQ